jgi:hypothetical protein
LYTSYENFVTRTEKYVQLKSKYPNLGNVDIMEMLHINSSENLPVILGRTPKFERLKFNQADRQNAKLIQPYSHQNVHPNIFGNYLWRRYYSSDQMYARDFIKNPEPSLFCKGGYKFANTLNIKSRTCHLDLSSTYVVHPNIQIRNYKNRSRYEIEHINLDDMADDANDSMHQYHSQKYKSSNNPYLLKGRSDIKDLQAPEAEVLFRELFLS